MTLSIAILFEPVNSDDFDAIATTLSRLAEVNGYAMSFGTGRCLSAVKAGAESFINSRKDCSISFLHAPKESRMAEAWEIAETLQPGNSRARFLSFVQQLPSATRNLTSSLAIVFAISWQPFQKFRHVSGTVDELSAYLQRPCGWCDELWVEEERSFWCDDETPMIFYFT